MHPNRTRLTAVLAVAAMAAIGLLLPALRADAAPTYERKAGADRYETAAAVSAARFAAGVPVAYVAAGANFPDALAGGAAAAKSDGPVLLTQQSTVPESTKAELDRLNPGKIVILGGTASVADAVLTAVDPYTDGTVTRVAGTDRYDTAAKLSAETFPANVTTVYVAAGATFPDALAGGPAAFKEGPGPLLLVGDVIPQTTKDELTRLSATKVVVLGGASTVPESVVTALDPYSDDPVARVSGADRFATSVEVSKRAFPSGASTVYLASGRNFPDALAGGAAAAKAGGPMLLTEKDCIPPAVKAEITRLNADAAVVVLGGTATVGNAVLSGTVCEPPASTTSSTLFPSISNAADGAVCTAPEGTPGYNGNQQSPAFFTCSATPCGSTTPTAERHWKKAPCPA